MADDHDEATSVSAAGTSVEKSGSYHASPGTAVVTSDRIENPGFRPYRPRVTDVDPKKEKSAERAVSTMFVLSIIGTVAAVVAYIIFPIVEGEPTTVRFS